jgi:hypothetical protein
MGFELFTEYGAASRDEATIRARGSIFLSDAIVNRANVSDPQAAKLYYDKTTDRLGIELLAKYDASDKAQRKISKERSGISVNANPILRYFGFPLGEKKSAPIEVEEKMIVIKLAGLKG